MTDDIVRVDDFRQEQIFKNVHSILMLAFLRHARPYDFGEPVDIERSQVEPGFNLLAYVFRPGLGAKDAQAQFETALDVNSLFVDCFGDDQRIRRCAGQDGCAEILQQHHLSFGQAAGDWHYGGSDPVCANMDTQPACKQTVTIRPRHDLRPNVEVRSRVTGDGRFAGRARGTVNAGDLVPRHGKQAKRIVISQVAFFSDWQTLQVVQRIDVRGGYSSLSEFLVVKRNAFTDIGHDFLQAFRL